MRLIDRGGFFVAENAVVIGDVRLAKGVSVWYGAVVRGDLAPIAVGELTNVQDGCVLHCDPGLDLAVGSLVTIGHIAAVHCRRVGDRCLIGMHAVLLGGAEIGDDCVIAAGAVVREHQKIPARSIVAGVPGKVVGHVTDAQIAEAEERARRYLTTAQRHVDDKVDPKFMTEYGPPASG